MNFLVRFELSKSTEQLADLTCPDGIQIKTSTIPNAGKGVFATKTFEKSTFFGPYTGVRHTNFKTAQESGYAWSIADKHGKVFPRKNNNKSIKRYFFSFPLQMVYIVDGRDRKTSNWMRYVSRTNERKKDDLSDRIRSFLGQLYVNTRENNIENV